MVKKIKYLAPLLVLVLLASAFVSIPPAAVNAVRTIVIDPGHGGKDPGCSGSIHKEKDVALAVALKLGKYLEENFSDVKVIYTRTTDVFVELEDRALIANKAKADLFISIHCNAAGKPVIVTDPKTGKKHTKKYKNKKGKWVVVETTNPVPFGTETYVMGIKNEEGKMKVAQRENSAIFYEEDYEKKYGGFDPESEESYIIMSNYTSGYVIRSASLAVKIQDEYARKAGRIDKGVHRQSIWVLWRTSMPSVLTEIGYLTNPLEEEFLGSAKGQEYLAKALFRGLRKYKDEVEGRKKEYNDEFENQVPLENENVKAGNLPLVKKAAEEDDDNDTAQAAIPEDKDTEVTKTPTVAPDIKPIPVEEKTLEKEDTAVDAKGIADKFKKDQKELKEKTILIDDGPAPKITPPKNDLVFKVQVASSDVPLNLKSEKFNSLIDADFYKAGNVLKYTSGRFMNLKDAAAHQTELRTKGFADCFVVAFKNGQRVDMAEAKRLLEAKQ
jgi:N-acetylmuramoyl-L-alanine amidase